MIGLTSLTRRASAFLAMSALLVATSATVGTPVSAASAGASARFSVAQHLALTGTIVNPAGQPARNAYIGLGSTIARTNGLGQFQLHVLRSNTVPGFIWAPGAEYETFTYQLTWIPVGILGTVLPTFHLLSAFSNTMFGATMAGLPVQTGSHPLTAHIHGWSKYPLDGSVFVTRPNGWVHKYGLYTRGSHYSAAVPLGPKGEYQVEVLVSNGLELFSIPVFHGVTPSLPTGPAFPADPRTSNELTLGNFSLRLINRVRTSMGLPHVWTQRRVRLAALAHSEDIARYGYYFSHPHIGSDGSTPEGRLQSAGVQFRSVGEAIGAGPSLGEVMDSLFLSPAHRMILEGNYKSAGIGVARWDNMWVVTIDLCR